tara:strand:- start:13376 stop:14029 length:654 start_codon:yes stop_codon:yes gene_type:complete
MSITAIIPVRKGSVRVKNKNTKPFANSNLLEIKINKLKEIKNLDNIVVSSDCEKMLDMANSLGVETHAREDYYASSGVNNSDFFRNLAESIECENVLYSPVTCPLISTDTYQECIRRYSYENLRNLVTVSPVKHHMWLHGQPLNYDIKNSPNSQDLPEIYRITYGICLIDRQLMIEYCNVVSSDPSFYILDEIESVDIDTEFDFMVAEEIYKKIYIN